MLRDWWLFIINKGKSSSDTPKKMSPQEKIERKLVEQKILYAISTFAFSSNNEDDLISFVTTILSDNLFTDRLGFLFLDPDSSNIYVHPTYLGITEGAIEKEFTLGHGIVGKVIESGSPILVQNTAEISENIPDSNEEMLSKLCVPIFLHGKSIGAINAESRMQNQFNIEDQQFLSSISNEVGSAINRIRLFNLEVQRRTEAEITENFSRKLTSTLNLDEIYRIFLDTMHSYLGYDSASIFIKEDNYLKIVASKGFSEDKFVNGMIIRDVENDVLFSELGKDQAPLVLSDARIDQRFKDYANMKQVRGWLGLPLINEEDLIGYATFDSLVPGKFSSSNTQMAQTLVNLASGAISRAKLFAQTNLRYNRLQALNEIDKVITSNLELSASFDAFLEVVCSYLGIDAASILIFDEHSQSLVFENSFGFRTNALQYTNLPLGVGYAGISIQEQRPIYIRELDIDQTPFALSKHFTEEDFKSYYCIPMISKGEVKGVLELFHRSIYEATEEWEEFIKSLATQVAITIENSSLIDEYQKANLNLSLGIDATLAGWAKTLELRDQETEGHSQRVVDLTIRLAREMGLPFQELIHVRRGALLHDIGKIGIPDDILLKPGKLNEEEWAIMKQHTTYAYNALKDIEFLKPALSIPYSHHEKWDGSGYPLGLKGEKIPLDARIFAIIDAYDALGSDRPYRDAWPHDKILSYIEEQSGIHFDPAVVEKFFNVIKK